MNPILSVLVRRAALAGPALLSQLHTAAALAVDERPDGAWHLEWSALRALARQTVVAAAQVTELLGGLHVDPARMAATADASRDDLLAEARSVASLVDDPSAAAQSPADLQEYLGATDVIIEAALERARQHRGATR